MTIYKSIKDPVLWCFALCLSLLKTIGDIYFFHRSSVLLHTYFMIVSAPFISQETSQTNGPYRILTPKHKEEQTAVLHLLILRKNNRCDNICKKLCLSYNRRNSKKWVQRITLIVVEHNINLCAYPLTL